jgi:hypothetical protein
VKRGVKAMRVGNEGREAREMQGHPEMEGAWRERRGRELRIDTRAEEPPSDAMCGHQVVGMRTKKLVAYHIFPLARPKSLEPPRQLLRLNVLVVLVAIGDAVGRPVELLDIGGPDVLAGEAHYRGFCDWVW